MTWLIDTNIISEVRKGLHCDVNVAAWYRTINDADLYLSVLVVGEIRKGIERVQDRDPAKASALERWLAEVNLAFDGRILAVDQRVADQWGRISAIRSVPVIDAQLAATAMVHGLTFVTRNDRDVAGLGAAVLNPFNWSP